MAGLLPTSHQFPLTSDAFPITLWGQQILNFPEHIILFLVSAFAHTVVSTYNVSFLASLPTSSVSINNAYVFYPLAFTSAISISRKSAGSHLYFPIVCMSAHAHTHAIHLHILIALTVLHCNSVIMSPPTRL